MKLDTVIPTEAPAIVAEAQQRKLGKYDLYGSWAKAGTVSIANFRTTLNGQPVGQPKDEGPGPTAPFMAVDTDWGEQDDGKGIPRSKMPTSIKLAIDPTAAPEGDE